VLRCYPAEWRARYGEELLALLADAAGDRRPAPLHYVSLARAGLGERLRSAGLVGADRPPATVVRSGALLVLAAFAAFVVGGTAFAKFAEHWQAATPRADRAVPAAAYEIVSALAVAGALAVAAGALAAGPALVRHVHARGWRRLRRRFLWAAGLLVALAVSLGALSWWAHHLSGPQRNGASLAYAVAVTLLAGLFAVTLGSGVAAAAAAVGRAPLSGRVLGVEAVLAASVAGAMAVMTAMTAVWWGTVASAAPGFFAAGGRPSPWSVTMTGATVLMLAATALGLYGAARALSARGRLAAA
jgi:hypothetical protein